MPCCKAFLKKLSVKRLPRQRFMQRFVMSSLKLTACKFIEPLPVADYSMYLESDKKFKIICCNKNRLYLSLFKNQITNYEQS
jgi:hypothetical protein